MNAHMNLKIRKDFKWYYDKGYITARDGNACYRTGEGFVVTASGSVKNELNQLYDFIGVDKELNIIQPSQFLPMKPSIESGAHVAALHQSGKNCSVHVHSPNTVALAALFDRDTFVGTRHRPTENHLEEALNRNWPELFRYTKVGHVVPFLDPGSKKLHDCIVSCLTFWGTVVTKYDEENEPIDFEEKRQFCDIVIMQRHGVLAIGDTMEECMEHIVRLEHVSGILLKIVTASGNLESIL